MGLRWTLATLLVMVMIMAVSSEDASNEKEERDAKGVIKSVLDVNLLDLKNKKFSSQKMKTRSNFVIKSAGRKPGKITLIKSGKKKPKRGKKQRRKKPKRPKINVSKVVKKGASKGSKKGRKKRKKSKKGRRSKRGKGASMNNLLKGAIQSAATRPSKGSPNRPVKGGGRKKLPKKCAPRDIDCFKRKLMKLIKNFVGIPAAQKAALAEVIERNADKTAMSSEVGDKSSADNSLNDLEDKMDELT